MARKPTWDSQERFDRWKSPSLLPLRARTSRPGPTRTGTRSSSSSGRDDVDATVCRGNGRWIERGSASWTSRAPYRVCVLGIATPSEICRVAGLGADTSRFQRRKWSVDRSGWPARYLDRKGPWARKEGEGCGYGCK